MAKGRPALRDLRVFRRFVFVYHAPVLGMSWYKLVRNLPPAPRLP